MHFDFKVTTWERVRLNQEDAKDAVEKFKAGEITSANDLFGEYPSAEFEFVEISSEQMTPEENGGFSTVEVFDDKGKMIHNNSIPKNERV